MLERRAEPGGDQQRAELVAVQRDGMRLIVHPRPADMRGRGVIQEFFFDRVPVEPGDGAQPPGDGGPGPAPASRSRAKLSMSAADGEQGQGAGAAPGGELAQVECVGVAGQAAVAGQVPARASRSGR